MRNIFLKLYTQHKSNSKQRDVEFKLTLEEWTAIWIESGKWEQRGRGAEKYCMCRVGDSGAYEIGNVFIDFGKRNVSDGNLGKLDSDETKRKKSEAAKGKSKPWSRGDKNPMHRPDVKAKISLATGGANHYRAIGVTTPEGFFVTAQAAANSLGMKRSTVEWRARHNKFGFTYGNNLAIA